MNMPPTELAITICALPGRYGEADGWTSADQVAHRLALLGFECTAQQAAAWLARMARADANLVERRQSPWGDGWHYRVTRFGKTDVENKLTSLRPLTSWLPTMRGTA
jgi:hypothetical protein